ncbi:MAG: HEAT repeat domain-containing protein [Cyanobacteria bacterium J06635_1]
MVEWLAVSTGLELGKLVLGQVLDLSKPVLEGYVEDFFKDCLDSGVTRLKADSLKIPMAEAIGFFIKRFVKELQFNDVPDTSIEHHYRSALKRFVRDKTVGKLLGKAFETGCKQIDYAQLEHLWTQQYQESGWQFPTEEFDWRGVAKEYVVEVKGIIKANAEIRALLETDLLAEIAQNTAHISPGFDVASYKESLQASYGYLKLYTLDSTDRVDAIALWRIFIEQTVREALPPMRYELPLDLKRKLQDEGQLEDDLSPEALAHYRRDYFQQPARKVLEAVADSQRAIILGDPGAGKSTLLQYLALEWVEGNAEPLPLLIELREYVLAQSTNFLDFLERGRGADWQFDQQKLHQHLLENPTLIMFDGLDEVFDRATQATVIDDIIRFAQKYPQARVLVTSRIIGYNPERFQHAGFRQFTLQPLDEVEMHAFIERWYDLSMGSDPDRARLKQRLKDAIANSKAIQNLADNPLLLTMMAILNRRQELPRDRADLYDQASRVLLYHWDVDHKRLQLPLDAIGRREKQEMLRLIAYEMQAGEEGLKGNLISAERLTQILAEYLRNQGFSESREKANKLIQQLRERNFVLCYRGADTYGFVHRTFLEYFCAVEIVDQFEKQRALTFERLRDGIFGQHWQDEIWYEVLGLVCSMIDAKFASELIKFLMNIEFEQSTFLKFDEDKERLTPEGLTNLLLAADCWMEVSNQKLINATGTHLLHVLSQKVEQPDITPSFQAAQALLNRIVLYFPNTDTLSWLKTCARRADDWRMREAILYVVAEYFKKDSTVLPWLEEFSQQDTSGPVRWTAFMAIVRLFRNTPEHLPQLKTIARQDKDRYLKQASVQAIGKYFHEDPETFPWLKIRIEEEQDPSVRWAAARTFAEFYSDQPQTILVLKHHAQNDKDEWIRSEFAKIVMKSWKDSPETLIWLKSLLKRDASIWTRQEVIKEIPLVWKNITGLELLAEITTDSDMDKRYSHESTVLVNPRLVALIAITENYLTYPKTLQLLSDIAVNDSDEHLRAWVKKQLKLRNENI